MGRGALVEPTGTQGMCEMDLFAFVGLSNVEILSGAAVVFAGAATVSLAMRALRNGGEKALDARVNRLEIRMAAAQTYQPALQMADEVLSQVSTSAVSPVIEMFEGIPARRSWFSKSEEPTEIAATLVSDLRDNIECAAEISRPIRNMLDNGAIEVSAERARLAADCRERAASLGSETWNRHRGAVLTAGMPDVTSAAVIDCFTRIRTLKATVEGLGRKPSSDQLIDVLRQSAELVTAAAAAHDTFTRVANGEEAPAAEEAHEEAPAEAAA
jgi:hypothetical protein